MSEPVDIPPHLRQPPHPPPDEDCDDTQKIVVTPVYRGRLEESHLRTRRAWQRRPWYAVTYRRWARNTNDFFNEHAQTIFTTATYIAGIVLLILVAILFFRKRR